MAQKDMSLDDLLQKVASLLNDQDKKIATAESCTGGFLGHMLTNVSGSSSYFDRGVISYSNQSKIDLLDVSEKDLIDYGAVSRPVAHAMAEGIKKNAGVDIGVSTTGIAGPTGGTEEKPVGLVYIGLAAEKTWVNKYVFSGNRDENKYETVYHALVMVYEHLNGK